MSTTRKRRIVTWAAMVLAGVVGWSWLSVTQQDDVAQLVLARRGSLSGPPRSPGLFHYWYSRLFGTGVTARNTDVRTVNLQDTSFADDDLQLLITFGHSQLTSLEVLNLENTQITDGALRNIGVFPELKRLILEGTKVSDSGLESVVDIAKLDSLNLEGTQITDDGLKTLSAMANLEDLSLNKTTVTDAGLRHLYALTRLKTLDLRHTEVSQAAVDELQAALPGCRILFTLSDAF